MCAFVLTACGSTSTHSAGVSQGSTYQRLVSAYVDYARCARSHGMPNLPDPQVDEQGNDHYPTLDRRGSWVWPQSVIDGCAMTWERVHAIRDQFDSEQAQHQPRSPISHEQALALARCIRTHGFPTFPDPNASGGFNVNAVPAGFRKPNVSAQARAAINACSRQRS